MSPSNCLCTYLSIAPISQHNGTVVPRELFDYVSFVNEPPSAIIPAPPGRKSKDSKSKQKQKQKQKSNANSVRGRGRPPSISESSPPASMKSTNQNQQDANAEIVDGLEEREQDKRGATDDHEQCDGGNDADEDDDEENKERKEGEDEAHNVSTDAIEVCEDAGTVDPGTEEERKDSQQHDGGPGNQANPAAAPLGPDIVLDSTHPMLGLWEGSFNVKVPTGMLYVTGSDISDTKGYLLTQLIFVNFR